MCRAPSEKQNEEHGWEQGGGGCCSCPWTTQPGHGCVGIPWPLPQGRLLPGTMEVQPCHPAAPCQLLLAPAAALDHATEPCSKDVNKRGKKSKMYVPFKGQNHGRADRRQHEPTHQSTQLRFSKLFSPLCDMLLHCLAQKLLKDFSSPTLTAMNMRKHLQFSNSSVLLPSDDYTCGSLCFHFAFCSFNTSLPLAQPPLNELKETLQQQLAG